MSDDVPTLVAPTEWVGSSPHHMSIGGTITGAFDTLLDLLEAIGGCVTDNGFDAVLFVNGHGGNRALVEGVPRVLGPEYPDTDVRACTYFDLPESEYIDGIRGSDHGGMAHAGEFETALMLHLSPELVDESSLDATMRERDMFNCSGVAGPNQNNPYETTELSEHSSERLGKSRLSSAEADGGEASLKRVRSAGGKPRRTVFDGGNESHQSASVLAECVTVSPGRGTVVSVTREVVIVGGRRIVFPAEWTLCLLPFAVVYNAQQRRGCRDDEEETKENRNTGLARIQKEGDSYQSKERQLKDEHGVPQRHQRAETILEEVI